MNPNVDNSKPNWFVRALIIFIGLLLSAIIIYNFFVKEKGTITYGLILLICLILVLILSEIFDNIKFLRILSLNKTVEEKSNEVKVLQNEKQNLFNLLVTNISSNKNTMSNGISGLELKEIIKILKADPTKIQEETKAKEDEINKGENKNSKRRIDLRKLEDYSFKKFQESFNLKSYVMQQQIEFVSTDSVSAINPIFDGYLKSEIQEMFFEVKLQHSIIYNREALYLRLNNLFNYRKLTNSNVCLYVILVELEDSKKNVNMISVEDKIRREFKPAIDKELLKLHVIKLDTNQESEIYKN
jgi:hypothetical protein